MLKITAPDGNSMNASIIDTATGADIIKSMHVAAIDIRLRPDRLVEASAEIAVLQPDLECGRFDWTTKHPVTGKPTPLTALEFRDGTRVGFREDGAPIVNEPAEIPVPKIETVTLTLALDAKGTLHRLAKEMLGQDVPAPTEDVTVAEMVEALGFHLRLRLDPLPAALADGLSTVEPFTSPGGEPVEVKPADFWTVMRPASLKVQQPDAAVRIETRWGSRFMVAAGEHSGIFGSWADAIAAARAALVLGARATGPAVAKRHIVIERRGTVYTATFSPAPDGSRIGMPSASLDDIAAAAHGFIVEGKVPASYAETPAPVSPDASVCIGRYGDLLLVMSGAPLTDYVAMEFEEAQRVAQERLALGETFTDRLTRTDKHRLSAYVTIERFGDRYCASTGPERNGASMGFAANPAHSAEESLRAALSFTREYLTGRFSGVPAEAATA